MHEFSYHCMGYFNTCDNKCEKYKYPRSILFNFNKFYCVCVFFSERKLAYSLQMGTNYVCVEKFLCKEHFHNENSWITKWCL